MFAFFRWLARRTKPSTSVDVSHAAVETSPPPPAIEQSSDFSVLKKAQTDPISPEHGQTRAEEKALPDFSALKTVRNKSPLPVRAKPASPRPPLQPEHRPEPIPIVDLIISIQVEEPVRPPERPQATTKPAVTIKPRKKDQRVIGIQYQDAYGNVTERHITIRRTYQDQDGPHPDAVYVEAFCHLQQDVRTFREDRILCMFDPETGEVIKGAFHSPEPIPSEIAALPETITPAEIAATFTEHLTQMGWIPILTKDDMAAESLGCHKIGKHKKMLKYPTIALTFEPAYQSKVYGPDGDFQWIEEKRSKPWIVTTAKNTRRSFARPHKALQAFLDEAETNKPGR